MELDQVLRKRRTVRDYKKDVQITEEQLKYILFAGMAAPISRKDYSSVKITVVQQKELLHKLSNPCENESNLLYHVPTLILLSSQMSKIKNIDCFNISCIVENMLLAATELGLGSIYLTSFLRCVEDIESILKELEIPQGYRPMSAVGVGYQSEAKEMMSEIEGRIEVFRK